MSSRNISLFFLLCFFTIQGETATAKDQHSTTSTTTKPILNLTDVLIIQRPCEDNLTLMEMQVIGRKIECQDIWCSITETERIKTFQGPIRVGNGFDYLDKTLYINGGMRDGVGSTLVYKNCSAETKKEIPDLKKGIVNHCFVKMNNSASFIVGGNHYNETEIFVASDKTFMFNGKPGANWMNGSSLNIPRSNFQCSRMKSNTDKVTIVVIGGDGNFDSQSMEYLNISTYEWKHGPPLPQKLTDWFLVEDNKTRIYVFGKKSEDDPYRSIYFWEYGNPTWTELPQKQYNYIQLKTTTIPTPVDKTDGPMAKAGLGISIIAFVLLVVVTGLIYRRID